MPLEDEYRSRIKSPIANIQNVGGSGGGGSITAALFLQVLLVFISFSHAFTIGTNFLMHDI